MSTTVFDSGSAPPRAPGFAYLAISVVMLVVVAAVGITTRQASPPTVAEFAPRAVEQLKDVVTEDALGTGTEGGPGDESGPEGAAGGGTTTTTAPPADGGEDETAVPRVNRCVGNPPRQIEDPQSPPCVPFWSGDNGGKTYQGVSEAEIRIGIPQFDAYYHPVLEAFFNERFEFYGRRLKLINLGGSKSSAEEQRAAAEDADVNHDIFASAEMYEAYHYQDELARRGIISVARTPLFAEDYMREHRPYLWGYPMANDRMFSSIAEWICARLAGGKAVHGGPLMETRDRKFGLVFQVTSGTDNPASTAPLEKRLSACGIEIETRARYAGGTDTLDPAKAAASADAMNRGQVTTIICLCDSAVMGGMGRASTAQGYFPEWLMSTYIQQDISYVVRAFAPPEQLEHAFGLTFLPREVRPEDHPSWRAAKEIDPSSDQYTGDPVKLTEWDIAYRGMLLLASGIQMAGPRLTPQSFEDGMRKARFPNPPDRTMPGAVGFLDGDHTMTNDAAEFWWSNDARDPYKGQPGAFCYVRGGVRHQAGQWPRGEPDPFFTGPCDSGAR